MTRWSRRSAVRRGSPDGTSSISTPRIRCARGSSSGDSCAQRPGGGVWSAFPTHSPEEAAVPAISSPIDPETLAALRRDDERALERLFRDQYDTLITEAIGVVIDGATAA